MDREYCQNLPGVTTRIQAVLAGVHLDVYCGVETIMIYLTIQSFCQYPSTRTNVYFWLLFCFVHCMIISKVGHLILGLLCSKYLFYDFAGELSIAWMNLCVFTLLCKICDTLYQFVQNSTFPRIEKMLWGISLAYFGSFIFVFFYPFNNSDDLFNWFLFIVEAVLLCLFSAFSLILYKKYASLFEPFEAIRKLWLFCNCGLMLLLCVRTAFVLLETLHIPEEGAGGAYWYSLFVLFADICCEVIPSLLLVYFIRLQSGEVITDMLQAVRVPDIFMTLGANIRLSFESHEESDTHP